MCIRGSSQRHSDRYENPYAYRYAFVYCDPDGDTYPDGHANRDGNRRYSSQLADGDGHHQHANQFADVDSDSLADVHTDQHPALSLHGDHLDSG